MNLTDTTEEGQTVGNTIALTHRQLLTLETYVAQPDWEQARNEALEVLLHVGL